MNKYYCEKKEIINYCVVIEAETLNEAYDLLDLVITCDMESIEGCTKISGCRLLEQDEQYHYKDDILVKASANGYEVINGLT